MSFTPKTRLEKILCGVATTAKTRIEKAVQTAIQNAGSGGAAAPAADAGQHRVPFTVSQEGGEITVATEASISDAIAANDVHRPVIAEAELSGSGVVLLLPLIGVSYAEGQPYGLIFSGSFDFSSEGNDPEPTIMTLTFTPLGSKITTVEAAVKQG